MILGVYTTHTGGTMYKLSAIVLSLIVVAMAQYSTQKTGKTYSTYDYNTNSFMTTTNNNGRSTTYDYNTGTFLDSRKNDDGSVTTYDYGTSSFSTTKKSGTGYQTYDYSTSDFTNTQKLGNTYQINSDNKRTQKRVISSILTNDDE